MGDFIKRTKYAHCDIHKQYRGRLAKDRTPHGHHARKTMSTAVGHITAPGNQCLLAQILCASLTLKVKGKKNNSNTKKTCFQWLTANFFLHHVCFNVMCWVFCCFYGLWGSICIFKCSAFSFVASTGLGLRRRGRHTSGRLHCKRSHVKKQEPAWFKRYHPCS